MAGLRFLHHTHSERRWRDQWLYYTVFEVITCCVWEGSMGSFITQIIYETHREKLDCLTIATKHQSIMGLSRSPATQGWIKLIIWAGVLGGPAGKGHMLFHKVRRLSAMQYNTEHNLQPSLHTEGTSLLPEPWSSQLSSGHPSETFALCWNAEIIRLTGEFGSCQKNADDLTNWQRHFQVTGWYVCSYH